MTITKCVIYTRCAVKNQSGQSMSLNSQETECKKYILKNNWHLEHIFRDEGVSGICKNPPQQLSMMIDYCAKKHVDKVVVSSIDRITRDYIMYLQYKMKFDKLGIKLYSTSQEFMNNSSPESEFTTGVLYLLSDYNKILCNRSRLTKNASGK